LQGGLGGLVDITIRLAYIRT